MTINVDTIGETIRKLRQEQGMTLQELTDKSGIAMSSVVDLEAGRRKSGGTVATLLRLLEALGMECAIRPTGLEETMLDVVTHDGCDTRQGWVDSNYAGLAVVKHPHKRSIYSVTHVKSGKRLVPVSLRTLDEAVRCLRWLGREAYSRGLSWNVSEAEIEDNPERDEIRGQAMTLFEEGES